MFKNMRRCGIDQYAVYKAKSSHKNNLHQKRKEE
ncbi:hypothetical protein LI17339_18325 [Bacillus licheniformis LMG 17339]|nr:hypothetical protein LI17339_18325 [Bacillus licheniformis LMG 17339]